MSDFFHGWRRKAGCVLLVMTSFLTLAWIRSHVFFDVFVFERNHRHQLVFNMDGSAYWRSVKQNFDTGFPLHKWISANPTVPNAKILQSVGPTDAVWTVPYRLFAIPLTLLSAYLILWPGKRPERQTKAPVEGR